MTDFVVVPFYYGEGPDGGAMETRVTGRVPHQDNDHGFLVDTRWELGYFISGASAKEAMEENLILSYRYTQALSDVSWAGVDTDQSENGLTRLSFVPLQPPIGELQLHDLGQYNFNGKDVTVIVTTSHGGLHIRGDRHFKAKGFYHEDVATRHSNHPEFVKFIFAKMREKGFCTVEEARD